MKKTYIQIEDKLAEKDLDDLINYIKSKEIWFYELKERHQGSQRYVDVTVSIKICDSPKIERNK